MCLSNCLNNSVVSSIDPTICVQVISCPAGTIQDTVNNSICYKNVTSSPPCTPTQMLIGGLCYANCPVQFQDTGTSCVKQTFARLNVEPYCGFWSVYENGHCVTTGLWISLLCFFIFILIIFLLYIILKFIFKETRRHTKYY